MQREIPGWIAGLTLAMAGVSPGVMYNRDTGSSKSVSLAGLPPFASRANIPGCTAVLIAPNALLSAAHCVNYAASGTVTATWNGQNRTGAVFTNIGADHIVIVTTTPFDNTLGKMTAPYSGNAETGKLAWKVASGGNGVIGYGGYGPAYDGVFRAMTNRIEVDNVASPPAAATTDYLYYDFDRAPSRTTPNRLTSFYEGGTAPGDSGGPLYMFEDGRWFVIGVTSGPDAGFYRDGRVRTDMAQIETATGYSWARPTVPALEMKWLAQDLAATVADGAAVTSWPRQGGADAWSNSGGNGATGTATLAHNATPTGKAAIDFPGTARLALPAASNPVSNETAFTVAMVVRADTAGTGTETGWSANTGLLDADDAGTVNDWGLALASTGKPGLGVGNPDTTQYAAATSISDGQWHVVVATWDGSEVTGDAVGNDKNLSVYVDGLANAARRQAAEFLNVGRNAVTLTLGGSRGAARFLDGRIAEVRMYRGALDEAAVGTLIQEMKSTHITPQVGLAVTRPATGRAAVYQDQGLVIDGTLTGSMPTVSITQASGPGTAVISSGSAFPAQITFPATGTYQFNVTATDGASTMVKSVLVEVVASNFVGSGSIPATPVAVGGSWTTQNLGDAATAGNQTFGASTASLTGSGLGFQEVSDSLRFAWKPLIGDGSITARVTGFVSDNGGNAFGGIMLRSSLARESSNVSATVISGGGVRFTRRLEDASYTEPTTHTLRAPYWVRMKRVGNSFTGYRSEDGVTWIQQGTATTIAAIPSAAVWGLSVSGHTNTSVSEVKFDNVLLEPLAGQPAPGNAWAGADVGGPTETGSHSVSGNVYTLNGSGADIYGTTDQFYSLSQSYSGDAQLTARVVSQDMSDPAAKAGVMVRASTSADAANAFMAVTPRIGLPFQVRLTTASSTTADAVGTEDFAPPYWLRLVRSGNVFTCYRSTNGTTWFQLGQAETIADAPATMFAGLAMASINNNGNSVANFDNVSLLEGGSLPLAPNIGLAAGQNPDLADNFTLTATTDTAATWSWQKLTGPGMLTFRTQNTLAPQTAFSAAGAYTVRATAEANGVTTFVDQSFNFSLNARWNFNNAGNIEGWTAANPAAPTVAGGLVSATATSNDPQIYKTGACYVSGDLAKHLLVRYRSTATGSTQLFWGRVGAGGFVGGRSTTTGYSTANVWIGLLSNPSASADWAGQMITDLRFDPSGSTSSVYDIDWIALSDGDFDDDGLTDIAEGGADPDNDGLPNFEDPDSNNDGLPDSPLPPADVDGDGFPDLLETARYWNATPLTKTWQTSAADWNTAPLGGGTQGAWNPGDNALFDRPDSYTVTIPSTVVPGQVTFQAGQVTLAGSGGITAANLTVASPATLTLTSDPIASNTAVVNNGLLEVGNGGTTGTLGAATVTNTGTVRFNRSNSLTHSGVINGGSISKLGAGTLVLSGNNTFGSGTLTFGSGATNAGYLRLAHPKALGNYSKVTLASNTSGVSGIELTGGNTYAYAIDTVGRNTAAGSTFLRNISGSNTWQGAINITSGGGGYDIESLADTLTISGTIGATGTQTTRALNVKGSGNVTFAGPLTDIATARIALTKLDAGTLRLNATNTHVGATLVSGGTLLVNGSTVSAITVSAGATLGGGGQLASATFSGSSALSSATLSPGDAGTAALTVSGALTFGGHTRYRWEISDWLAAPGTTDRVDAGTLALAATPAAPLVIGVTPVSMVNYGAVERVFPIATASASLTGFDPAAVTVDASSIPQAVGVWSVRKTGNTLELVFSPDAYPSWIAGYPGISDLSRGADPDGDGWTNHDEWVTGTDPTQGGSRFSTTVTPAGLTFTRVPGRTYQIDTCTALNGDWVFHAAVASGSGPVTVAHPPAAGPRRFYRVIVTLQP